MGSLRTTQNYLMPVPKPRKYGYSRTYAFRSGHMRPSKKDKLAKLLPVYGLHPEQTPNWSEIFPTHQSLYIEIGSGAGEAALDFAKRNPIAALVCFEVFPAGVATLLSGIDAAELSNLKVVMADALPLLEYWFAPASLAGIRIFYPDPWPKKRHHKRRLVNAKFLATASKLLAVGGRLHLATDWPDYAEQMQELLTADPRWQILATGVAARNGRIETRFERRALAEGRQPWDCQATIVG